MVFQTNPPLQEYDCQLRPFWKKLIIEKYEIEYRQKSKNKKIDSCPDLDAKNQSTEI